METDRVDFPFLDNLGFMLTYRCTIACPHCIVEAGPRRSEEMSLSDCLDWIDQAKHYGSGDIRTIDLTGGEPFVDQEKLAQVSRYAEQAGFLVTVVTNAFWAVTPEQARAVMARVPAIAAYSFSTDIYHQRAIPLDYIKNAICAAKELKKAYNIAVCTENEADAAYQKTMAELRAIGEGENIMIAITSPVGRARHRAGKMNFATTAEPPVSACVMAGSPVVFPNGRVTACIGPLLTLPDDQPMVLGNLKQEPLAAILDRAEVNPVLHAIRVWGPAWLVQLLKENGYADLLPGSYIKNNICDVCYQLFRQPRLVEAIRTLFEEEERKHMVAYARLYYLDESAMLERYHLYEVIK